MNFSEFIEQNLLAVDIEKVLDDEKMCIAILINFSESYSLFLHIDNNTDEVNVHVLKNKEAIFSFLEENNNLRMYKLMDLAGFFLLRGWVMKNNRNYQDAVQLELWSEIQKESLCIQIQAIASSLEVYKLVGFE